LRGGERGERGTDNSKVLSGAGYLGEIKLSEVRREAGFSYWHWGKRNRKNPTHVR